MKLHDLPRIPLGSFPTPMEELSALRTRIGGPRILLKRDDLTGLGLGGNKIRKLEFLMAEARAQGADFVITTGGIQSNHTRLTAACARRLGMRCAVVLKGNPPEVYKGNLLLSAILDTEIHFLAPEVYFDRIKATMDEIAERRRAEGFTPYQIPLGGATPLGAAGYVACCEELAAQAREQRFKIDYLVLAVGSGGTQAGLEVGVRVFLPGTRVIGISVNVNTALTAERVAGVANGTLELLGIPGRVEPGELEIHDRYVGPAYAAMTEDGVAAIRFLAETEGLLLDPIYTGKAMAGLLDLVRSGRFQESETVLFLHTGGSPALFAFDTLFTPSAGR